MSDANSSQENVSPKGSSSSGDVFDTRPKPVFVKVAYPPPYWEEKIAKCHAVIQMLEHNPDLKIALHRCPTIAGEFMKHPEIGREVARDKKLATEIIRRPHLLSELADFHKYTRMQKRQKRIRKFVKQLQEEFIRDHVHRDGALVIPHPGKLRELDPSDSGGSVAIGRATLPNIPTHDPDEHPSIKYLYKAQRMFLRHDVTIQHGCTSCFNKKIGYYNILNSHARLMYRVFMRHKQTGQTHCRPYELVVKDPDSATMFVFVQMRDIRYRLKWAVEYPKGNVIGYVEERWHCRWRPFLLIKNSENEAMIQVDCQKRPFCSAIWKRYDPKFSFILRAIGAHNVIGQISCEWIDTPPGAFSHERIYGVNFPQGLTVNVKIIVMAAWMLVYLSYYTGMLEQCIHHTLTPAERAIIRMVEEDSESEEKNISEHSDDSGDEKEEIMMQKYRKIFETAAYGAKKRMGVQPSQDANMNKGAH